MWHRIINKVYIHIILLLVSYCLSATLAHAQKIYLAPGESRVIRTKENIETIFVSLSEIADYELISDNSMIIYAKKEGLAEFNAFNKNGQQIIKTTVLVNSTLSGMDKKIRAEYPDSNVLIKKIGKSYVLTGTVPTEEAKDHIYQIVGESIGTTKKEIHVSDGQKQGENIITFLSKVKYADVINKLTLPIANQVNVKLTIAEVTKDFTDNVGLEWGSVGYGMGLLNLAKFNADKLVTMVSAIRNDSIAKILAEPNLSVLSGETADFLVGGEYPVINRGTIAAGPSVHYKEYGVKLTIGAKVSEKNRIRIILGEEVSSVVKHHVKAGIAVPTFHTRRAKTTVELGDGESFILGGLINSEEKESLSKIPFIGDIPILGALFRNTSTERKTTELIVVATVNLVRPIASRDIILPNFRHTSTAERFFNFTSIRESRNKKWAMDFLNKGGFIK